MLNLSLMGNWKKKKLVAGMSWDCGCKIQNSGVHGVGESCAGMYPFGGAANW
jgi:hypothetical protein